MGYSPRFSRADRALDEIEAAALAQEAIDAARWALAARTAPRGDDDGEAYPSDVPLPSAPIAEALAPAGPGRVIQIEHVLVAAIWLGSIGVGLFRLLL